MGFRYKVSIIVPIYNVEEFLPSCLDSIINQTMDKKEMEVLLIVDGSPDNSLQICEQYAKENEFFKVFSKSNEGLSATRNYGIKRAQGKYIMYLDSDDEYSAETVKEVTSFFDKVYEQVDMVTYKIQPVKDGEKKKLHFRYKLLKKTGVYDLNDNPFISQTNINVCVKNLQDKNHLFDCNKTFHQEDQEYNNRVLMDKMKIGYCSKGEYIYNRNNDNSIVKVLFHSYYIFESSTAYFERLFSSFDEEIPKYFQAMFLSDVAWKMSSDILLPYHYGEEDFEKSKNRIRALMDKVDDDVILKHPNIARFFKFYLLKQKSNTFPIGVADNTGVNILHNGKSLYATDKIDVKIRKITIHKGELYLLAYAQSPVFNFIKEDIKIYVVINKRERIEQDVFKSVFSNYKSRVEDQFFPAFKFRWPVADVKELSVVISIGGCEIETRLKGSSTALFESINKGEYIRDNIHIRLCNGKLSFNTIKGNPFDKERSLVKKQTSILRLKERELKEKSIDYRENHRVWLYYDLYTVKKDNGYYQFINDVKHNDGIERYYVLNRPYKEVEHLFDSNTKDKVITFGSDKHKLLYLSAELILTGYYGLSPISPFDASEEEPLYGAQKHFKIIYLQHGVLHAHLYIANSVEKAQSDRIVVSSNFEVKNYSTNYHYDIDELLPFGMSRYDWIDREKEPKNRILYAPSWREYLTSRVAQSTWGVDNKRVLNSRYFKGIKDFLDDKRIVKCLEEKNLEIDLKMHPIIATAENMQIEFNNERVNVVTDEVHVEDYKMFITDFSSFVFDYICLERPVFYFVPDYEEFKSGMNHYRELDLPFEEAFGNLTTNADCAVEEFLRIANNDFIVDKLFKERMESFFVPLDNCAERLYSFLMKEYL